MTAISSRHVLDPGHRVDAHESPELSPMPITTPPPSAHFAKRSSWRKLRQGKRLRLSDLALKIPYASTPLAELSPKSEDSPHSRIFQVPGSAQVPSLKSPSDTVSLSSKSDWSGRTSASFQLQRITNCSAGRLQNPSSSGSDSSYQLYPQESPHVHIRSASEDSCRSGFSNYQDMDRLLISAKPKLDYFRAHDLGGISLDALRHSQSLVIRPKVDFDQRSRAHDHDTVTTASSRASIASTSRSSWTMSPPSSPMLGHTVLLHNQEAGTDLGAHRDPDCPPVANSLFDDSAQHSFQEPDRAPSEPDINNANSADVQDTGCQSFIDDVSRPHDSLNNPEELGHDVKVEHFEDDRVDAWAYISQDADYCEEQRLDKIWDFAVEQFPGLELANSLPLLRRRSCTRHFLSQIVDTLPDLVLQESSSSATEACDGVEQSPDPTSSQGRRESDTSQRKGKRKNPEKDEDDDLDDNSGGNNEEEDGPGPHKRRTRDARTEPADTYDFMCPFRLKDPQKFNVRDHRICALKVFKCNMARKEIGINELRRHIKDEHLLQGLERDPRNQCDRCKVFFKTQSEKENHVKASRCDYREHPTSRDPLDGIDIATRDRLVSKKGRQGQHPLKQYHGLCQIIFGDDTEELPHGHQLVREHFELHALYHEHLPKLLAKFQALLQLGPQGMASLGQILQDHYEGLFDSCTNGVPYEVFDIAPLAGIGTPNDRAPSPEQMDPPETTLSHHHQIATDSGIGMSISIDGDSCESLVKCSEGTPDFDPTHFARPQAHVQSEVSDRARSVEQSVASTTFSTHQLAAANMVDPGYSETLQLRHHVNPSFLQFTDGRPWLRVKDKDNGKTLRYPIRAPVPVQISNSSTVKTAIGPPTTQGHLPEFGWVPGFTDSAQYGSSFSSFHGSVDAPDGFVTTPSQQQVILPSYPQAAYHASSTIANTSTAATGQFYNQSFGSKMFPVMSNSGAQGTHQDPQNHQFGFAVPPAVYTVNSGCHGTMLQDQNNYF